MATRSTLPRTLGPYRLESLLGRGGMGEAFRAWDQRLGRYVAIKHVRDAGEGSRRRARFRREARTAAGLAHAAIVQIFDILEEDDGDWIVMELVEGHTLAELAQQGPLAVEDVLTHGAQVAEGLAAAHEKGVVHRDLKAENVMVTGSGSGQIKILDFGLAKQVVTEGGEPSISLEGEVMGTARAMSPEQAQGREVDHRSDLFSLGTLIYELATGISPFRSDSFVNTLNRVISHTQRPAVEVATGIPTELSGLIDRLLQKAPELRPVTAEEVARELRRIAGLASGSASRQEGSSEDMETWGDSVLEAWAADSTESASDARAGSPRRAMVPWIGLAVALGILALGGGSELWRVSPSVVPSAGQETATDQSEDPVAAYAQGVDYLRHSHREGNVERAIEVFEGMLARDERSASAYAGLAKAYWSQARDSGRDSTSLNKALAAAEEAVGLNEYFADARISRGLVYQAFGRNDASRGEFEAALELTPSNSEAYRGLGLLEDALGDIDAAETAFKQALELDPGDRFTFDFLGALYFRLGRYAEARDCFLSSIEVAPDSIHGYRNLASVFYIEGDLPQAAAMTQEALKIRSDSSLYSTLGLIFFAQGLYRKSATAYEQALGRDGAAHTYINWANLADAYRQIPGQEQDARQHYLRAIQLVDQEIERDSANINLRSRRALFLAKHGDRERAQAEIMRTLPLLEGEAWALFRLAVAAELIGDRSMAFHILKLALTAGFALAEVESDPELRALRADPEYHRLIMAGE